MISNSFPDVIDEAKEDAVAWKARSRPQESLLYAPFDEIFYGGSAGGGKTDGCLGEFAVHAGKYGANAKGVFFRHTTKQLEEVVERGRQIYGRLGARYVGGSKSIFIFPNGATLKIRHLRTMQDAENYQGHEYSRMYFEELTNWPTKGPVLKVMARLRSPTGVPCKAISTGNPGGKGHNWVKARYRIGEYPRGFHVIEDEITGLKRVYIPSRLTDNPVLMANDPNYANRIRQTGNKQLVDAWLHGLWDIIAGGFFDDIYDENVHILKPFDIPRTWTLRRGFDWGSSAPASCGFYAISNGEQPKGVDQYIPRGSMIRIDEIYTVSRDQSGAVEPNEGLRLGNKELGAMIARKSKKYLGRYRFNGCVADPSIFSDEGGPSIYDQMRAGAREKEQYSLIFKRADNNRKSGWSNMRDMLKNAVDYSGDRPEYPCLFVFENCTQWIRTVPVLQRDDKDQDDVDTDSEDHIGDEQRYAIQSLGYKSFTSGKLTGV